MSDPEETTPAHGIAIVGMSGRFPGARSLEEFWHNLHDGVESISFFTADELMEEGIDPTLLGSPEYVRAKGVIGGVEMFDCAFFGFTPREAALMDPQHRLLLECAWEGLEDAGDDPSRISGRAAVYVGSGTSSYLFSNLLPSRADLETVGPLQALILNDRDFVATRLSYKLDLRGPSAVVQTACSTSLMAVHMACQSLLAGESDLALAGGVSINVPVKEGYLYQEGSISSFDGHCRSFDAGASGSVPGIGAGLVVLKRLADALENGDTIHAVILGSAANNDGSAKVGFTAPSIEGQAEVIAEGLLMAGVEPDTIAYVEGHGSGTSLGDPIEISALRQAFARAGHGGRPCALGSVKSNIGHLNTAAGIAGLIKTVLALRHGTIPPSLHFERPNPQADFGPFHVPNQALPWPEDLSPRRAGVSSFGLGGTNVHAVLEEAPEVEPSGPSRSWQLLLLSARTPTALAAQAERLADRLDTGEPLNLADVAFTLQVGRRVFNHRMAVVCHDRSDAISELRMGKGASSSFEGSERPLVFLFPGLGDHYVDMGRELYESEPAFAAEVDRCAEILRSHLGADIREVLFSAAPREAPAAGPERRTDLRALLRRGGDDRNEASRRLDRTEYAQPVVFVVEYALARLLMAWGVRPQAMIGYSLGEYVAACLSGALSLEDALALVARRAKLIQELPAGAMLAVPLPESELRPFLGESLAIVATNGPHFCVVGGPDDAVADLDRRLSGQGVTCLRLTTTHAFHTSMMEPAAAALTELAASLTVGTPKIPYVSNVTGTWITAADLQDPGYWARHMVRPVRFAEGLAELLRDADRAMVEVGPGGTLSALVRQHPDAGAGRIAIATMRRESEQGSDLAVLLDALGRLWVEGVPLEATGLFAGQRRRRVPLPTYPFERQRCWIDPPKDAARDETPRPGALAREPDLADWFWVPVWKQTAPVIPAENSDLGSWLVFLDRCGVGERLASRLRGEGRDVLTVAAGGAFRAEEGAVTLDPSRGEDYEALVHLLREAGGLPSRIVHLWGLGEETGSEDAQEMGLLSLVFLEQALVAAGTDGPAIRIGVVGSRLHEILEGDRVQPAKAAVVGACKVVHQESSRLTCFSLDCTPDEGVVDRLLAEMSRDTLDPVVAYRGRQRWVRTFDRIRLPQASFSVLREEGVYLITDGGNACGVGLAELLTATLRSKVALLLPPAFPVRELWANWPETPGQDHVGDVARRLLALEGGPGIAGNLLILRTDMTDASALRKALDEVRACFGPLDGAFHTPGSFTGGLIQLKTRETLAAALAPIENGTRALLAALVDDERAFVVLMSSTLGFTGGLGQVDLAAAGSYFDALAQALASGPRRMVAAHWDPYQWQAWLVAGLGTLLQTEQQEELQAGAIPVTTSGEALGRVLGSGLSRVIVSARDLEAVIEETDALTAESFFAQMEKARRSGGTHSRDGLPTSYVSPRDEREERLAALWEELFGIAPIGIEDSFLELGGHSLLAIQMVTQVRSLFDADLPVTALFEAPTIAALSKLIGRTRGEESPEDLEALLALVEGLSPEDAARRLAEMEAPA
ncbi:MAG TPA: beta-ketoacyl synthase N-terminal-like domain-containing protein [Thermoanaerobaculia bacterium]|jgi:acyl transferase domain-containing protein/acyl carrier protein|nr:beta-ketoacyl synthase N-terminal-like domain-containing protein [Thermoanaerobaculia bacterium]